MESAERLLPGALLDQWWALIVRGLIGILFGVLAFMWPQITMIVLIALFAAFALLDGVTSIAAAIRARDWGWPLWGGLLSLAAGVVTIAWPATAGIALVLLIGAWAVVRGVFDIATAIALRRVLRYEWVLALGGLISILFGALVLLRPAAGALAIVGLIAAFAIFWGVVLVLAGIHLRRMRDEWRRLMSGPTAPSAA